MVLFFFPVVFFFLSRVLTKRKSILQRKEKFISKNTEDRQTYQVQRPMQTRVRVWVHQLRSGYDLGQGISPFCDPNISPLWGWTVSCYKCKLLTKKATHTPSPLSYPAKNVKPESKPMGTIRQIRIKGCSVKLAWLEKKNHCLERQRLASCSTSR